jgi:hypothetical protein
MPNRDHGFFDGYLVIVTLSACFDSQANQLISQASRTACFEMAKLDFALRTEHYKTVPDHKVYQSQGQFKMFNSAMIAGISAIIDPRGPDGDTMRRILGTFLELNPWAEVRSKDETTRKEVRIVRRCI